MCYRILLKYKVIYFVNNEDYVIKFYKIYFFIPQDVI